jgi:hypothetical protein
MILTTQSFAKNIDYNTYGPLVVYAQSPAQAGSLTPLLRSGFTLSEGQKELYLSATASSVWIETDDYFADYYHNSLNGGMRWQISENWLLDSSYLWHFSANNNLDSVTIWFHDTLGIGQNGRKDTPKHQNQIMTANGVNLTDFSGETLNNAFTLYIAYQLFEEQHHGLSLGGSLYYNNVSSGPFAHESFEQALQLNYGYRYNKHNVSFTAGISFKEDEEVISNIPYKDNAYMFGLGYEFITGNHGWLIEVHHYQGMLKTENDLSKPSDEVLLGYRYYMNDSAIEFTINENFLNMDNSSDIAFTLGYRSMFP